MFFCNQFCCLFKENRGGFHAGTTGLTLNFTVAYQNPVQRIKAWVNHQYTSFIVNLQANLLFRMCLLIHKSKKPSNWLRNDLDGLHFNRALLRDLVGPKESFFNFSNMLAVLELGHR